MVRSDRPALGAADRNGGVGDGEAEVASGIGDVTGRLTPARRAARRSSLGKRLSRHPQVNADHRRETLEPANCALGD